MLTPHETKSFHINAREEKEFYSTPRSTSPSAVTSNTQSSTPIGPYSDLLERQQPHCSLIDRERGD